MSTSNPAPVPGTVYRVALDAASSARLVSYLSALAEPLDVELVPTYLEPGDTVYLGEQTGHDREDAVERLLEVGPLDAPPLIVKRAEEASKAAHEGVALMFVVSAAAYVGEVPVELDRRLKIG